jgi:hypothetical protein
MDSLYLTISLLQNAWFALGISHNSLRFLCSLLVFSEHNCPK